MNKLVPITIYLLLLFHSQIEAQTTIDIKDDWRFNPDSKNVGIAEKWFADNYDDTHWVILQAGKRWEEQGYPELDGYAWYRKHVEIPAEWKGKEIWLVLGGVNDTYVLFCNGKRVNSFGDKKENGVAGKPTLAELSRYLRIGKINTIAIQVYDWEISGGLWHLPCVLTIDKSNLDILPLDGYLMYDKNQLIVETDLSCLGNEWSGGKIFMELTCDESVFSIPKKEIDIAGGENIITAEFPLPDTGAAYAVKSVVKDLASKDIVTKTIEIDWLKRPSWPAEYGHLKILNNFVTELLNLQLPDKPPANKLHFSNPREGWVFFSVSNEKNKSSASSILINGDTTPLVLRKNPDTKAEEAMQFLSAGKHNLRIKGASGCRLVVRTIPEIIYSDYPSSPHVKPYGTYDWVYLTKHVLSHVNTIITRSDNENIEQWAKEGRKWLGCSSLPGLRSDTPPTVDQVYNVWANNLGVRNPRFSGIIVDEFLSASRGHYDAWTEGVRRLHKNPSLGGKIFYAYCGDIFSNLTGPEFVFGRELMRLGDRFSLERYFPEQATEEEAELYLLKHLQHTHRIQRKNLPGIEKHLVICLGYLSDPPETLNRNPGVNYKVFMDMQFQHLATDPTFWGLYGIQEYLCSYADEEVLRWAHRLFRHYCIEGNRNRLSSDPYILPHLENPDFADGLEGWDTQPAGDGSIEVKQMEGFSWLQGRYPRTSEGDQFLWMKRSAQRPNIVRQTVKKLQPGRLYLLKLFSADLQQLDKKQKLAISVKLDNVDLIEENCFQFVYPSCYSHELGPYNRKHPAWMNYHRILFRPHHNTAVLNISDWVSQSEHGDPVGQESVCNFIEIQPYFE